MRPLRFLGWLLIVVAVVALVPDVLRSVRAGVIDTQPIGALWYSLSPGSLIRAQAWVQAYIDPAVWNRGVFPLLTMPAWVPSGFLGVVFLLVTRRKPHRH
ncbi:MAG: hypothetical protein NTY59_03245 [Alphaproteobacteria bacterium]|nr:hypothetical protein [Alphaproteobacteria bacterium]